MNTEAKPDKIDFKKELGNPKITFVIGGPASGKGTQCAKLVEEFGYTHISTGDLMRLEMKKGSREGDRIRKIVNEGGLVPYELTVQVLVNAMIATPSQNYLIDGFPRAVDQAMYFEQNVCSAQSVLFFNVSPEVCLERCLGRAAASEEKRADDSEEVLMKRLEAYKQQTKPVIELYRRFGKVKEIDGSHDELTVYENTRKAMLPQVCFIIGPQAAGKTTLGAVLCERTNQKQINFNDFIAENKLVGKDDETVVLSLIKQLSCEQACSVLIEDFPKTEFQAKFFIKNCVEPFRVFALKCSKDVCQERMIKLGAGSDKYQASTILAKKIRQYNEDCQKLMPFLEKCTNLREVNTEQTLSQACAQICGFVEPSVLHVRCGGSDTATKTSRAVCAGLTQDQKYFELDVNSLIRDEIERRTELGLEIHQLVNSGQIISPELIVCMLKCIIYNGDPCNDKFLLTGFPDSNEGVKCFEDSCANITAIIYAAGPEPTVEILHNNLNSFNIDSMFSKQFRLKTMKEWNSREFEEQLGSKTEWGIISGRSLSGKTTVANMVAQLNRGKILNMEKISEECKKRLGTEDEPFEGDVPIAEVEKDCIAIVNKDKACGEQYTYLFDGYLHKNAEAFVNWFATCFGCPSFHLQLAVDKAIIEERYKKKNEIEAEGEINEDQQAEIKAGEKAAEAELKSFALAFSSIGQPREIFLNTDCSLESTLEKLRSDFCAKIILLNHENRLNVDTACSNLAIKHNMLYLSVYQLIKDNVEKCTPLGEALVASCKPKGLQKGRVNMDQNEQCDEFEFSAVHYDLPIVMQVIKETIQAKRTNQSFILLEGLCNSTKLSEQDDRLELRQMDELFALEKNVGEVNSVISLLFCAEETQIAEDQKVFEEFEKPVEKEVKPVKAEGEEDDAPVEEAAPEDGENAKPKFNPAEFQWTITNAKPKNLPQLFRDFKGSVINEQKKSDEFAGSSNMECVALALDAFCNRLVEDGGNRNFFQQVVFAE